MQLTISAYSTALFSTWYFIEELGVLFDAGDGVTSSLLQKSRKIKHIFVSHADRDHLAGLIQLNQLNARPGYPKVYFPKDSGSFLALENFSKRFDKNVEHTIWTPIDSSNHIAIKKGFYVEAIANDHMIAYSDGLKSLSFKIVECKHKLKKKFLAYSKQEIENIAKGKDSKQLTEEVKSDFLGYSGDTPIRNDDHWNQCKILIHEATFIEAAHDHPVNTKGGKHSTLEEVLAMTSSSKIEQLILGHFSSRYDKKQIITYIRKLCKVFKIQIPVFAIFPGEVSRNILKNKAVNH